MSATPTVKDAENAIEELVLARAADRPPTLIRPKANMAYAPVVFAHVSHLHQLAAAVLTLHRSGQMLAAMPLVRQSLECALRAVWLETYRENLPALVYEGERQRRNALDEAARTGHIRANDEALLASRDWCDQNEDVRGATSGSVFRQLCVELDGGEPIYALYRLASNYTHPGSMLTDLYVDIEHVGSGGQRFITNPVLETGEAWLKYEAYLLILGGLAWDRVDSARHHHARLIRLAPLFEVPVDRVAPTAEGWSNSYRAERDRKRRKKNTPAQRAREDLARAAANVASRRGALDQAETALLKAASRAHLAGVALNEAARAAGLTPEQLEEHTAARRRNWPAAGR